MDGDHRAAAGPATAGPQSEAPSQRQAPPADVAPFAITLTDTQIASSSAIGSPPGATKPVADDLVWTVVALSVIPAAALLLADLRYVAILGPIVYAVQILLLVLDRRSIGRSGHRAPGWLWIVLVPAYLFRRARALGRRPTQGYALVGIGILMRVGIAVFGGGMDAVLDTSELAANLNGLHEQTWDMPATTACDRWVNATPGTRFICTTRFAPGGTFTVELEVLNEQGELQEVGTSLRDMRFSSSG